MNSLNHNICIMAAFGATRELAFLRVGSSVARNDDGGAARSYDEPVRLYLPQPNNTAICVGRDVNIQWMSGLNSIPQDERQGKGTVTLYLYGRAEDVVDEPGGPPLLKLETNRSECSSSSIKCTDYRSLAGPYIDAKRVDKLLSSVKWLRPGDPPREGEKGTLRTEEVDLKGPSSEPTALLRPLKSPRRGSISTAEDSERYLKSPRRGSLPTCDSSDDSEKHLFVMLCNSIHYATKNDGSYPGWAQEGLVASGFYRYLGGKNSDRFQLTRAALLRRGMIESGRRDLTQQHTPVVVCSSSKKPGVLSHEMYLRLTEAGISLLERNRRRASGPL